ncbi:hypothetical protein ASC99_29015 [Kitasatospora sp. Root107]|nr:hypothetical protein ASC99_29015 [Kitasatospora sp. Root107]
MRTVPSSEVVASQVPSGEIATADTGLVLGRASRRAGWGRSGRGQALLRPACVICPVRAVVWSRQRGRSWRRLRRMLVRAYPGSVRWRRWEAWIRSRARAAASGTGTWRRSVMGALGPRWCSRVSVHRRSLVGAWASLVRPAARRFSTAWSRR